MKLRLVLIVYLSLIASSNCGLIDGLLGTVKDTTSSITHGIGSALHSGKNFVFGGTETTAEGRTVNKPGIVGRISLTIHDVSQSVREEVRSVLYMFDGDKQHGQKGIVGRFYDRMKNRVFKVKGFLFGDSGTPNENVANPPFKKLESDTAILSDKLKKHFFKNNTNNSGIRKILINLNDAIYRIRHNITRNNQDSGKKDNKHENEEEDGAGMIDIRASVTDLAGGIQTDFANGVDAAYDKVNDDFNERRQKVKSTAADAKRNTQDFIENQKTNVQNNYNKLADEAKKFKSDVDNSIDGLGTKMGDETDAFKQLLDQGYTKIDFAPH